MGRMLVLIGLGIAALGLLVMWGVPLGRLPGDFYVRRGSVSFYFPLASSIIVGDRSTPTTVPAPQVLSRRE